MNRASAVVRKPCLQCRALRRMLQAAVEHELRATSCDGSEVRRAYQPWGSTDVLLYLQRWADPSGAASAC
jgi:hypothetical protein